MHSNRDLITIDNMLPGTVSIRRMAPARWRVGQRHSGHYEHHQAATWLRINNPGTPRTVEIEIRWAEFDTMSYRRFAYLKHGRTHRPVSGTIKPTATAFRVPLPTGESFFGPAPWYSIEDGARWTERVRRTVAGARLDTIGTTLEGRPIRVLRLDAAPHQPGRPNVVVLTREHAVETAGSFALEEVVRFLTETPEGRRRLRQFVFHLLPAANPDGVANGRKLPQEAPKEVSDLHYAGMASNDPTCRAVREWMFALKPACLINLHGYLFPVPQIIFYDRADGMAMLDQLFQRKSDRETPGWYARWQVAENKTMLHYCVRKFGTVLGLFELPWTGQTVPQAQALGLQMFQSVLAAHDRRRKGQA